MKLAHVFALLVVAITSNGEAALVGLWRFEGDETDSSGLGNHGSMVGPGAYMADVPSGIGSGQSLNFGAVQVVVPHDDSLSISSTMTIAAWVKPVGNIGWDGILAKNPSNGSAANHAGNYELRIENGSRQLTFLHQRGGVDDTIGSGSTEPGAIIGENLWSHVAVTLEVGGNVDYYVDGVLVDSVALPSGFGATNSNSLVIGSRADNFTDFEGNLDDVAIFDTVLSVDAINVVKGGDFSAFTGTIPEPSTGLLLGLFGSFWIALRRVRPRRES